MIYSFFKEVPKEILETDRMNGATTYQEVAYVLLPLALPGIASTALLSIILSWNEAFWSLNLTTFDSYIEKQFEQQSESHWGICGVGLLKYDQKMQTVLQSQDGLYTLVERSSTEDTARVIGAITEYLLAPENSQAVINKLANEFCRIVTLTITEGGYYVIEGTGEFDVNHTNIQHDLQHPD